MKAFKTYGKLTKHDIGAIIENGAWNGTAMLCISPKHTSISINIQDFKFASNCFEFVYCQNKENKVAVLPMLEAKELFKRGRDHGEFVTLEWFEIENPSTNIEIPFN